MSGRMVEFPSNGSTTKGFLTGEDGPGVIVIQEWWGLNDQIKRTAGRFAAEGFVALAPDLYHGELTTEPDEAGKLMMALDIERVAKDVRGAAAYLAGETGGRIGVIGYCMGGQLALFTGTVASGDVGAVVDMYGIHPAVRPDYTKMRAPVLGLFAGQDAMVDADAVAGLAKELDAAGVRYDFHTYPGTHHAFMRDGDAELHAPEAAADAWSRVLAFFRENLG